MKEINRNVRIGLERKLYLNIIFNCAQFSIWALFQGKHNNLQII